MKETKAQKIKRLETRLNHYTSKAPLRLKVATQNEISKLKRGKNGNKK